MGAFVSATAFRTTDAAALSAAICRYAAAHGVTCEDVAVSDDFGSNTLIFAPQNGWTVVFWPDQFVGLDVPTVVTLTRELHLLASVIFVDNGRYWAHVLVENGIEIEHACEKSCACTTCHVVIREGYSALAPPEEDEEDLLDRAWGLEPTSRLSCQACVVDTPLTIEIPRYTVNMAAEGHKK